MTSGIIKLRRIVIVTSGSLGSNPRVVKEAQVLHELGYEVTVICTRVAKFVDIRDLSIIGRAGYKIIRLDFNNRLTRIIERLWSEAARKLFSISKHPRAAELGFSLMTRRLTKAAISIQADLYIAHYIAALPAAAKAAGVNGAHFAFDAEDFHLGELPNLPQYNRERTIVRSIEQNLLPRAAYITAASPMIADSYFTAYGVELPKVVMNVFPRTNGPEEPTVKGDATPGPSVYWFSQTIGAGRGLETALEAIALAGMKPHLHLRGTVSNEYRLELRKLATELKVADRLHFHDPLEPDALERSGASFDLGYVGETGETLNRQVALTNKLFSYLTSGIPVVASNIPAHVNIAYSLNDALYLFKIGDASSLAKIFDDLLCSADRLSRIRRIAWRYGQNELSWESERLKIEHIIKNLELKRFPV